LAAFSRFSERLNWKIMENGKNGKTVPRGLVVDGSVPHGDSPERLASGLARLVLGHPTFCDRFCVHLHLENRLHSGIQFATVAPTSGASQFLPDGPT
jgi:hypothetical protein